jgi:hypothetical protein
MWFYIQMALPLLTVGFAAAICFGVVSFIVAHAKPLPQAAAFILKAKIQGKRRFHATCFRVGATG